MKKKQIKLTKEQIEETEILIENCDVAHIAFERASRMMKEADKGLWHYLNQTFPKIKHPASFDRGLKTIDYYE